MHANNKHGYLYKDEAAILRDHVSTVALNVFHDFFLLWHNWFKKDARPNETSEHRD